MAELDQRVFLTVEEAMSRLAVANGKVSVASNPSPLVYLRADWDVDDVRAAMEWAESVEEAGPRATADGYGIAIFRGESWAFVATVPEKQS